MSIILRSSGLSQENQCFHTTFDRILPYDQNLGFKQMSEEIIQKGYEEHGLIIGKYQFYNLGSTTISTLKKYKIIPNRDYKEYEKKKPDALLVDRRNKSKPLVIAVIEHKSPDEFNTKKQKKEAVEQCNNYAQVLKAKIGIATDKSKFIWFNPNHKNSDNEYQDKSSKTNRSYSVIQEENEDDFTKPFDIDQKTDEDEITRLNINTRNSIENIELIKNIVNSKTSKLQKHELKDPTGLAKQIWQDIWSVTGRDPEKCLYTFVEIFIFKYLSDLNILDKDDDGHPVNFKEIIKLDSTEAFGNYMNTVRPYLESLFEPSDHDGTTIINGSVLNKDVPQHRLVFYKILKRFDKFGELKNIDPKFKSKVFEEFMKQNNSTKNWGRYFTPRNVIDAMIEMSDIDKLEEGSKVCDPACGVGGFILEPLKVKNSTKFYYPVKTGKIKPRLNFCGFDKGFEKDEQLTIILAKANMLLFLSELLKTNSELIEDFSKLFNDTFKLTVNSIMGTLETIEKDTYDLILTNPPYVTSGSSNYKERIKKDGDLKKFYKINGLGVESLFLEWIIRSLRPSKKSFVVIPDGILNRVPSGNDLRKFIKDQCFIDGVISLPVNTFYTTPKKTYILALTKKPEDTDEEREKNKQEDPVFTYLVKNTGETLDVNRFKMDENDLKEMVCLFKQFVAVKDSFKSTSSKCKIFKIGKFLPESHWSVDRWWSKEEKILLGMDDKEVILSLKEFIQKSTDLETKIHNLNTELTKSDSIKNVVTSKEVFLNDSNYFEIGIGERVTKKEVYKTEGIPIYSSNVFKPFGYLPTWNIKDFDHDYVLWGIDGNFEFNIKRKREEFGTTDHCGTIKILDENILPEYLLYQLDLKKHELGFDRSLRASLSNMELVSIDIPFTENNEIDVEKQKEIVLKYGMMKNMKKEIQMELSELENTEFRLFEE